MSSTQDTLNLPNYFLADLPREATLTPAMILEACQTLRRNRDAYLAGRSTRELIDLLCEVGAKWRSPDYHFRKLALREGPAATGFPETTLARGLDEFFAWFRPEHFHDLLKQDLGHTRALEPLNPDDIESRLALVRAPKLLVHVTAGMIPNPVFLNICLGVLLRAAQVVKCPTGASLLPRLFAHSLYDADRKLGACLEIAEWRGGNAAIEDPLFAQAHCVTATGSDETLLAIRNRLPPGVRFVGYGHRVSFGYVAGDVLSGSEARQAAAQAAADIAAWNQLGCLSPHAIFVERTGMLGVDQFAEMLAEELAKREQFEPRGPVAPATAATIASRRNVFEIRAAHSADTKLWQSEGSTAWTVVYEREAQFTLSCLNRFVHVIGVPDLKGALQSADAVRGKVSTVGLAAGKATAPRLISQLADWGVARVCPLGRMQNPPLTWRHDGRPALADLVEWTDWER
ncbi:MAG TPA: hypothetical protein GYA07_02470 [Verrucomicrobia bacterium]|nr:hypothetical protein [Verrucomicrobiota bacterium]HOB32849.1 acyl-CoA reductase [Verrucomicrobiota bacterium]HOP98466.1 acyl-CoA reductase [Verrucomicrobiota bacterium]